MTMENKLPNAFFAGAGTVGSGEYNEVTCSGSAKITGDIKCNSFSCAGSAKAAGDIVCGEMMKISGSFSSNGCVKAKELRVSGATRFLKSVEATQLHVAGSFRAEENVSAEKAVIRGAASISGLLNAETVDILFERGEGSEIGAIGGGTVIIKCKASSGFRKIFKKNVAKFKVGEIEADSVELEQVAAKTVRAMNAVIGDGCEIGVLEYSDTLNVSENAKIGEIVKK